MCQLSMLQEEAKQLEADTQNMRNGSPRRLMNHGAGGKSSPTAQSRHPFSNQGSPRSPSGGSRRRACWWSCSAWSIGLWLNQMLPESPIYDGWTKCPGNSTVPVHTHCRPALCCCGIPTVSLCFVVLAYWGSLSCCRSCAIILSMVDLSFSLYTVDSTRG